ncbi:MAG TPA: helix-turn-helix transcriptional regulator [Patescibacteria group bacterium]|nr:helix-turn-helix transcriptional regulator [Patescibacteria group bacterium]
MSTPQRLSYVRSPPFFFAARDSAPGLSLAQVAERLGATSINAYARYEQDRSVPTIQKLSELFAAVMPHRNLVLVESET